MYFKRTVVLGTVVLSSWWLSAFSQGTVHPLPESKNRFIVIAHRGSHLVKPENSIAAIEEAIALGADYVEIDLRTTRDGQLVLLHNETVDQQSNGKGRVQDLDFEAIKKLTLKGKDGSLHQIASFTDALKVCKDRINIYLDFKAAEAAKAYQAIESAAMQHQVMVYVNGNDQYDAWRKVAPEMPLMSRLNKAIRTNEDLLAWFNDRPLEAIDKLPPEGLLPTAHKLGIRIFADVQQANESAEDWMNAMNSGIQGMQTDHPQALIEYLKINNLRDGLKNSAGNK